MPLSSYGVLKATILDRRHATDRSDHYQLFCGVGTTRWRVAINAHSDEPPSDVMYAAFRTTPRLANLEDGWRVLRPREGLDYVRGGLCRPEQFKPLPLSKPGASNDLNELFDLHLTRGGKVYAFGEPFATSTRTRATSGGTGTTTASGRTAACWSRRTPPGRRSCCASSRSRGARTTPPPRSLTARGSRWTLEASLLTQHRRHGQP